ncbi:MAG: DNA methylase [Candidatus Saccharimonadales bacterium]
MPRKARQSHSAADFDLDVLSGDMDMFRWFLLCYLLGKPIQSVVAVKTWQLFIEEKLDTPWAIAEASDYRLVSVLHEGGYTRYQHVVAHGLQVCMERLIREYDGSLYLMLESSMDEDEFSKRIQKLYGVGPKIAEIFMRETEEVFARRVE